MVHLELTGTDPLAGYGITDALTPGGALTGSSLEAVAGSPVLQMVMT